MDDSSALSLASGTSVASSSSFHTIVTIELTHADSNALKAIVDLAIDASSTYLTLGAGAVQDTNGQGIAAISPAIGVSTYTADTTAPTLTNFDLDMDSGVLTLSFSETVKASTLTQTAISLQTLATDASPFALTGGVRSSTNSDVLTIALLTADLNNIKKASPLCSASDKCFIVITDAAVKDMADRKVAAITNGNAQAVQNYNADATEPTLSVYIEPECWKRIVHVL